jgi:hypothetical protein
MGKQHHIFGFCMHIFYTIIFTTYSYFIYMQAYTDSRIPNYLSIALSIGIFFPWMYETIQLQREGLISYFFDKWNYVDFIYVYSSIGNIVL